MRSPLCGLLVAAVVSCFDGQEESAPFMEPDCSDGQLRDDGSCLRVGVQPNGCRAGELFVEGECIVAGAASLCASGFVADERGGCAPILPEATCGAGTVALMGDSACRPVAECASGRWSGIAVEPSTVYVDASYPGIDADGTQRRPFPTIQQGIDAAPAGAIVAVTDGAYVEHVDIVGKAVRLWAVCPSRVSLMADTSDATLLISSADGAVVRGLAVSGGQDALVVAGSTGVLLEQLWIHDTSGHAVWVSDEIGDAAALIRDSLIEHAAVAGVKASGTSVEVERAVVRGATASALSGVGLVALRSATGRRGALHIRGSIVELADPASVGALASDLVIEGSLLRDSPGSGLEIAAASDGEPAMLSARSTVIERTHAHGVGVFGSAATLEGLVIRDVFIHPTTSNALGISAYENAEIVVRLSLVERASTGLATNASATLEGLAIRETAPQELSGYGMQFGSLEKAASVMVVGSLLEGNHAGGLVVAGSSAQLDGIVVRGTRPRPSGLNGQGVHVQVLGGRRSDASLRYSVVEQNHEVGMAVAASDVVVESSAFLDTRAQASSSLFGDGVAALHYLGGSAQLEIVDSLIASSARAGIASFGSVVRVAGSVIECNVVDLNADDDGELASFENLGNNRCGCKGSTRACKIASVELEPPSALETGP